MSFEEICAQFPRVNRDYCSDHVSPSLSTFRALQVESQADMTKRMATTIDALMHRYSTDNFICVSHASPSQTLVGCVLFGAHRIASNDSDPLHNSIPFADLGPIGVCGIYQCVREYSGDTWRVVRNGDVKHLSSGMMYPWHY